jgi:cellulose synthase/poly-beta-1,6-N-acetylglucosamine synthase-like glycosyltransferase
MVVELLALTILLYGIVYVISNLRFLLRTKRVVPPSSKHWPSAVVLAPHKGIEPEIEHNITSLLSQNYPSSWEVIFITKSEDDPAYSAIQELLNSRQGARARLVTAGEAGISSQKITNLLRALREVSEDTEVLSFIDSDLRVSPLWLQSLVAPLSQSGVGAATGYRLLCPKGGFWKAICSLWDSVRLVAIDNPRISFPWGGSMAMKYELFRQLEVARIWQKSLSDDLSLGQVLREKGLFIAFSPLACGITQPPSTLLEFWEWATRQMVWPRLYGRRLWFANLAGLVFHHLALIGGVLLMYSGGWLSIALPILLLSRILGALLRQQAVEILSSGNMRWPVSLPLLDPFIPTLSLLLWLSAWKVEEVEWRGIVYRLKDYR